jgi:hypothetical protein
VRSSPLRRSKLWLALFALTLAGCGGCKGKVASKEQPASFFPQRTKSMLLVENPAELAEGLRRLDSLRAGALAKLALGLEADSDPFEPLVRQLGFDPRGQEGLALVGLDRNRGIGIGQDERGRTLFVAGVTDAGVASRWIAEVAKRQGGLTKTERIWEGEEGQKLSLPTFLGSDGNIRLAYGLAGNWIVAAEGLEAVTAVGEAILRKDADSLAGTRGFELARERQGGGRTLWGWMPPQRQRNPRQRSLLGGGYSYGLTLGEGTVAGRLRIPQGTLELSVLQAATTQVAGAELLPLLGGRDFFVSRVGGDPLALEPLLRPLFPSTFRQLRRAGIDPAKEILSHLRPGIVLGVALEPEPNLSAGLPVEPSLSTTNPFHFVQTALVAQVKDRELAAALLENLAGAGEKLRMQITTEEVEGLRVHSATYAAGEGLTWALWEDKLLVAGGTGAFDGLLARVRSQGKEEARASLGTLFDAGASAAHLDVQLLARQLREIPSTSFGIGGFRLKAVLDGWVAMLEELGGVTAAFSVDAEGIVLDAEVRLE